ncbi:hypothetical protein Tco_0895506, partial [Tanacetum coccineum]
GKRFSGKVTPLFDTMLVQPTQDEGVSSERLSAEQSSPSPTPTSEVPNESLPDSTSAQPSEEPYCWDLRFDDYKTTYAYMKINETKRT